MEFVEKQTLNKVIGKEVGPIPYSKAIPLFIQILEAIRLSHKQKIIHPELNPSDITLTSDNKIEIAKSEISRKEGTTQLPKAENKKRFIPYLSPERLKRESVNEQTDIYNLGIILYEMLAGETPFEKYGNTSDFTLMNKIVNEELDDPREICPSIPEWLVKIIYLATAKEKSVRISNADAFISLLKTEFDAFEKQRKEEIEKEEQLKIALAEEEKQSHEKIVKIKELKKEAAISLQPQPAKAVKPAAQHQSKINKRSRKKIFTWISFVVGLAITATSFLIIYDNKTVDNIWMSTNLNVDHYKNGDAIPEVKDSIEWAKLKTGAWCYYENQPENGKKFGKLYNWYAINDPRGLAPAGWFIPTTKEFEELKKIADNNGNSLISTEYVDGTNKSGFSALLAGYRDSVGCFYDISYVPYFWSISECDSGNAYALVLPYHESHISLSSYGKGNGFSVRCFKPKEKLLH